MKGLIAKTFDSLFPPTCVLCGGDGASSLDLCAGCYQDLPYLGAACRRCALPLSTDSIGGDNALLCGRCIVNPPGFDRLYCPLVYEPPVDWMIQRLKFNARLSHVRVLGRLLEDGIARRCRKLPDLLVPVPLHGNRFDERGFNQALEIARPLARRFEIRLGADVCQRRHDTPHQLSLPAKKRRANVRKAFCLRRSVKNQHVVVVDDVVTTGSTVGELARMLKRGGARRVDVWAVARAVVN